jgi:transposase-like protein
MAFKPEDFQTDRQIKVCLDKNTHQALCDSADSHKVLPSVLGRMIIMDYVNVLRDSNAGSPIAQALKEAAKLASRSPVKRTSEVKVRLTLEDFKLWKAIAVRLNVLHTPLARVAIKEFLDAERNGKELRSGMSLGELLEINGNTPTKLLTPEQQKLLEMEAQIARLERERTILKQAAAILLAE